MTTRPNIIFIMADDHAAQAISAYGSRVNRTPQLDRIADEGVRLDAVFCTNSICSPSRASILTGTYSHINGVSSIWTELDYRVPTFIDVLQAGGYRTAMFGKWHLGEHGDSLPRGFDAWKIFPGQGDYVDPEMIDQHGASHVSGYATDIVTDLSIDWIDGLGEDEPFCVMVHHKAPHRPWIPDEKHKHPLCRRQHPRARDVLRRLRDAQHGGARGAHDDRRRHGFRGPQVRGPRASQGP
ncbi:sulfatase-like hydrolase/transferase [Plantibacter sp. RU18]|uniref:sulfatase-like hydrolase/transferase n=1 Tax=Plantibacter sp. RU18 TaxID=3158143 RepID=UPI003D35A485